MKDESVFYPAALLAQARRNVAQYAWAADIQASVVKAAEPWLGFSDEALWDMMFGNTIRRSWMVWSNGHCPACKGGVPMYDWRIDALKEPWKLRCPHCAEAFPKNDFHAFYRSGLDEKAVFDPARADRSLLFNADHPEPGDPLRDFGVDDGNGYRDGENTWRFIATYLIYGQWKQAVHGGIRNLSAAYTMTGDRTYAHKALVLLDRVADLYPSFNFKDEGVMYEGPAHAGYVSTWHDACEETREMALAYDQVRSALSDDADLVTFLSGKAKACGLANGKASKEDIRRNIEEGVLRHPIEHEDRIHTNYPRREIALVIIKTVLDRHAYRADISQMIDDMLERATAIDGVTGEKGLAGYTAGVIQSMAQFIERFSRIDPAFLSDLIDRHPKLKQTYRFHMDMWCLQQYYPQAGDTGSYARKFERYAGALFSKSPGLLPSTYSLFWRFYEVTDDPAYVQVLYHENGGTITNLPHDLFAEDPEGFQAGVQEVIEEHGTEIRLTSVNKPDWHIAVLRSGVGSEGRAAWIDYDSGGAHGHADGMNLGLFAKGLDLMPDFGYPPVQYGGWKGQKFQWYVSTTGHNTVVVDGKDQARTAAGKHTLWGAGPHFRAIRVSGPELYGIDQYERTLVMANLSERDSYLLDIFRVVGGADHAKFMHSHFGTLATSGLELAPSEDYGFETLMRDFKADRRAQPGWSAEWMVEDRFGYLQDGEEVRLRYVDLTTGAEAAVAEAWVSLGGYEDAWIPRLMVRRQAEPGPLASTFVGLIEPHDGRSKVRTVKRLGLVSESGAAYSEPFVAVEVERADGGRDLILAADVENPQGAAPGLTEGGTMVQEDWEVRTAAELCVIRKDRQGAVTRAAFWNGSSIEAGDAKVGLLERTGFAEVSFEGGRPEVVSEG